MRRSVFAALLFIGAAAAVARAGDAVPAGDARDLNEIVRRRSEMREEYDAAQAERAEAIRAAARRAKAGGHGMPGWRNASDWGVDAAAEPPEEAPAAAAAPAPEEEGDVGSTLVVVAGLGILLLLGLKVFAPGLLGRSR